METIEDLLADTMAICAVPAPTGSEGRRAELVAGLFRTVGLEAGIDAAGNLIADRPGDPALPCLALVAHLDTVFAGLTEIVVREEDGWLAAPGIGDNSAGVAALLAVARRLPSRGLGRILFVASVGEEGNGDLAGARHLMDTRGGEIDAFLAIEGAMRDRIVYRGLGVERLRLTIEGPGGHSWGDAGTPSAVAGAAEVIRALYGVEFPDGERCSLNVGTVRGGTSINSIAARAELDLDLRSLAQDAVERLRERAARVARRALAGRPELDLTIERIGSRPAGSLDPDHALLQHVRQARADTGLEPAGEDASSTDANIPLSRGVPACCLGVGLGTDCHRETERLEVDGLAQGLTALCRAVGAIAADSGLLRR